MEDQKRDTSKEACGQSVKTTYSTPKLSDYGSVETLSLTGTQNPNNENPGMKKNKP